ncbi:cytosolic protein [Candidatus Woesearchaeota archaeon]|nr:cytosolic protein [Candidatus Woesearchaeota archaeon]
MECQTEKNLKRCNCTYEGCSRKGLCCECLHYHLAKKQLPACCFPPEAEATFDRSFEKFVEIQSR